MDFVSVFSLHSDSSVANLPLFLKNGALYPVQASLVAQMVKNLPAVQGIQF